MFKKILLFTVCIVVVSSLMSSFALAQNLGDASRELGKVGVEAGVSDNADIPSVIGAGINAALALVGLIFMILMIYAGYLWMTARGEEEQIKKSQKIIIASVIGLVIVVSAYAITFMVTSRF